MIRQLTLAVALVAVLASPAWAQERRVPASQAELQLSYAPLVKKVAPAVVNVYAAKVVRTRNPLFDDPIFRQFFGGNMPGGGTQIERSLGSGVIVDASGLIVTNVHVIEGADEVKVALNDKREFEAQVVLKDKRSDLAVLRIKTGGAKLPYLDLGNSDQLQVGDVVLAIGDPLGLSQTVTHGIVSATARGQLGITTFEDFIQTDAPINFGNSGGALVDSSGALIGINTAMVAKSLGVEGIGFAIPVDMVRGVLNDIIEYGRVIRGWIGIVPEDISDAQARQLGLAHGGVVVANLYVGSPGQQAGLKPGDLLLAIDGAPVTFAQAANAHIADCKPGTTLTLRDQRGSSQFDVKVKVGERPRTAG